MRDISPESPEARRKRLASAKAHLGTIRDRMPSRSQAWEVIKRVAIGVYSDGFIHAGNLAYLALLSIFPFVIVAAAVARLFGQTEQGLDAVNALVHQQSIPLSDGALAVPVPPTPCHCWRSSAQRSARHTGRRCIHRSGPCTARAGRPRPLRSRSG